MRHEASHSRRALRPLLYAVCAVCAVLALSTVPGRAAELDPITVQSKKEREQLRRDVDAFIKSALTRYWDRPLLRWNTPVCPLVAGLPRDQGEFVLRRLSQSAHDAGAPLAPEKCRANFLVLVTSEPEELLAKLRKRDPEMFSLHDGEGTVQHFLKTDRPIRVWYNWSYAGSGGTAYSTAATISGSNSPSAAADGGAPVLRASNSRLSYSAGRSIDSAIIAVDLPHMKGVNIGQLTDYVTMIGLAEINLDKEIVNAPTVLRLFDDSGAPTEGMSGWDKALLQALYGSRQQDVTQSSQIQQKVLDSLAPR